MNHDGVVQSVATLLRERKPWRHDDDDMYDDLLTIGIRRAVASVELVGDSLEAEARARLRDRCDHARRTLQGGELLNALLDLHTEHSLSNALQRLGAMRVFCWGRINDGAELAAITRVLGETEALVAEARRYEGEGVVAYHLMDLRHSLVKIADINVRSLTAAGVMGPPSRDADGVPLLSKSEIDRVVPAKFGIDDTWGAIPIGGELRARQARAILVAAALYDTRRRQLLAALHGTAAEPAAKRQRTEETL